MRLLREVMDHPLDPAYELAARRRATGVGPGRTGVVVTVLLALACGAFVTRGVIQLTRPEPGQAAARAALEREIDRRTASSDALQRRIESLRAEIVVAQQAHLTSPGDAELASRLDGLALQAGELAVTGPGLEIKMTDAPSVAPGPGGVDPRADQGADDGRVLDRDVQAVTNALWAAGAEAIAINGRRLTSLAAIRSAGRAILVDFRPLVPPYVIRAVGDPAALESNFVAGAGGSYVQTLRNNFGIDVGITRSQQMRLPGAGTFELRAAAPPVAPSGPPPSSKRSSSSLSSTESSSSTEVQP